MPQFLRQGDAGVPDVDADADDGVFQLAGFQAHAAFGENAAELFPVQIQVVYPLDLHLCAVKGINGSGGSDGGAGSQQRRILQRDRLGQDHREVQSRSGRGHKSAALSAFSGSLAVGGNHCAVLCPVPHQRLAGVVGGGKFRVDIQGMSQDAAVEIGTDGLFRQQVYALCQPIAGLFLCLDGKALFL